jgi:FlaA1/EpsC-like NDP-sugar epimerase
MAALPLEPDVIKFVIPKLDQESTMTQKLSGKVALVTGDTSSIGLATTQQLLTGLAKSLQWEKHQLRHHV